MISELKTERNFIEIEICSPHNLADKSFDNDPAHPRKLVTSKCTISAMSIESIYQFEGVGRFRTKPDSPSSRPDFRLTCIQSNSGNCYFTPESYEIIREKILNSTENEK